MTYYFQFLKSFEVEVFDETSMCTERLKKAVGVKIKTPLNALIWKYLNIIYT